MSADAGFPPLSFWSNLREYASSLGLEWIGDLQGHRVVDASGTTHPRLKIVYRCKPGEVATTAERIIKEIAEKHGPGWIRTVVPTLLAYMGTGYEPSPSQLDAEGFVKLGCYYAHQNATEGT